MFIDTLHIQKRVAAAVAVIVALPCVLLAQASSQNLSRAINVARFHDSAHHWKDITDRDQVIGQLPDQSYYDADQVQEIADNVLRYQLSNGGWPKNYDMLAKLTPEQKHKLKSGKQALHTGFDNGATHAQISYLAEAYSRLHLPRYKKAVERGLGYVFNSQYENGGWPQFYPDTSGYHKYITFNDGAMVGIMQLLQDIAQDDSDYAFLDDAMRKQAIEAYKKGLDCILKMQILEHGHKTVWCQQHDNKNLSPAHARAYELPSKASQESTEIVELLMEVEHPDSNIVKAVDDAVEWFRKSSISRLRVKQINANDTTYRFHSTKRDKRVVHDSSAPLLWARFYELETNRPLFANRDGQKVYSLSEVARERRTGYAWYGYWPDKLLIMEYPAWKKSMEGETKQYK